MKRHQKVAHAEPNGKYNRRIAIEVRVSIKVDNEPKKQAYIKVMGKYISITDDEIKNVPEGFVVMYM